MLCSADMAVLCEVCATAREVAGKSIEIVELIYDPEERCDACGREGMPLYCGPIESMI